MQFRTKHIYAIIDIPGYISYEMAQNLEKSAVEHVPEGFANVVLNMENVPRIDSNSLGSLIRISVKLSRRKINMFLMGLSNQIKTVMEMAGAQRYFRFIPNEMMLEQIETENKLEEFLQRNSAYSVGSVL
ncbi:MAG: STAS domain-containing protein [Spirochaetes bacterium]|nr:STAS domain-containing protein [Spirochaetota bacterium]